MQKNHLTDRDKRLLALNREQRALWIRSRQKVIIDPPVQRGWVRRWRLTQRANLRPDAEVLKTILPALNSEQFFWRRSFKRGKHSRRRWHETSQSLRVIHEWQWSRLGWPDAWKERYFRRTETTGWSGRWVVSYSFSREDDFELYTDRHFISELPLHQPEVEARLSEIEAAMGFAGQNRLNNITDGGYRNGPDERRKYRERMGRRRIRLALLGDWEAERARKPPVFPQPSVFHQVIARVAQQQRHGVESAASVSAILTAGTISRTTSIEVMQRTFNPQSMEHYPGGPPIHSTPCIPCHPPKLLL